MSEDSATNRRLAILTIDNAVELAIRTYLALPSAVTGISLPREELRDIADNLPFLLDALEIHATDRAIAGEVREIRQYHRLRDGLYQDPPMALERDEVDGYAVAARALFRALFGTDLAMRTERPTQEHMVDLYVQEFSDLEAMIRRAAQRVNHQADYRLPLRQALAEIADYLPQDKLHDWTLLFEEHQRLRNRAVHGGLQSHHPSVEDIGELRVLAQQMAPSLRRLY